MAIEIKNAPVATLGNVDIAREIIRMRHVAKGIKAREDALRKELLDRLSNLPVRLVTGKEKDILVQDEESTRFQTKAFKADHLDLYQEYSETSTATKIREVKPE